MGSAAHRFLHAAGGTIDARLADGILRFLAQSRAGRDDSHTVASLVVDAVVDTAPPRASGAGRERLQRGIWRNGRQRAFVVGRGSGIGRTGSERRSAHVAGGAEWADAAAGRLAAV